MNYRLIARYLGLLSLAIAGLMLVSVVWAAADREWTVLVEILLASLAAALAGLALWVFGRSAPERFLQREALGLVGLSWLWIAGLGALPFIFTGTFGPLDAYFESMSGFTTTGASVLADFDGTPRAVMFWRSFTHWLGGMGIIVLFVAVLPYLGAGGKQLFKSEAPGPDPRGLRPRIKDTAKILYSIYVGFTVAQTVALMLAGLSLYEALCQTFGTLATGGFSTELRSISGFDSLAVELIIIVFMICAGTNFALYFAILRRNPWALFRDAEWRTYIGLLAAATLLITVSLLAAGGDVTGDVPSPGDERTGPWAALRYAAFQVVSIMTTTGYATADFDNWPYFSRMGLLALMFVGGSAGSTGGGLKVVRIVMLLKMAYWRLESTFRPRTVRAIRIGGQVIDENMQRVASSFFVLWMGWFAVGALFMSALGLPLETALTSVAATLNNIGPGLADVGARQDYRAIPDAGKVFLTLSMALGRLELFSILVLLVPSFWRGK
jgi:trk system potassium uptake protein TrkH